jgi:CheY-like chemotaxis protein
MQQKGDSYRMPVSCQHNSLHVLDINKCSKRKVLLVEDNPIVRRVHFMMLERVGCHVDVAEDGYKALSMLDNKYDLILMDIGLPGMDGLQVTSYIRKQECCPSTRVPIIALTAYSTEDTKMSCLEAGSDEVAIKPIAFRDLQQLLERWFLKSLTHNISG